MNRINSSRAKDQSELIFSLQEKFLVLIENQKLVLVDQNLFKVRSGEDKLVSVDKREGVLVSNSSKQISVSSDGILFNGQTLSDLIRSKMK